MNKKENILCIIGMLLMLGIGFFGGFLSFYSSEKIVLEVSLLSKYACHDGCSLATIDVDGYLTNLTWDCWDKCNDYLIEIWEGVIK